MHNPTFKRPEAHCRPGRSPSPPSQFVEPLSPVLGTKSLAPIFTYPAVTQNEHGKTVGRRGDDAWHETPTARSKGAGQKSRSHHRTPSNIDALAEVALAASPVFQFTTTTIIPSTTSTRKYNHTHSGHGSGEPPHKRARSELISSATLPRDFSRPATSYESPVDSYQSRAEEAALLLNFRAGGWPVAEATPSQHAQSLPSSDSYVSKATRPHANSLPRDAAPASFTNTLPRSGLLPPFRLDKRITTSKGLSSTREVTSNGRGYAEHAIKEDAVRPGTSGGTTFELGSSATQYKVKHDDEVSLSRTPSDEDSRTNSIDPNTGEASEAAPVKKRRGWPKGKPRGPSSRKSMVEKPAPKRSTARRKTTDAVQRSKNEGVAESSDSDATILRRRNSLSDAILTTGRTPDQHRRSTSVPRDIHMIIRSSTLSKPTRRTTRVTQEISCAGCAIVRDLLNYNGELKDEWISCNGCKQWFHFDCAGFKKAHEVRDVDKYFCPPCEPAHGKTTYVRKSTRAHVSVDYAELQKGVLKTSEESMEHHYIQPIKDGTFQFDPEFFPRMPPELVTKDFFERGGFVEPICIPASLNPRPWLKKNSETKDEDGDVEMTSSATDDNDSDGLALDDFEYDALPDVGQDKLGMVMPQDLTVRQVCSLVGPETPLDVIDVKTQNSGGKKWNLKRWADYYEETGDKHIRNVISLEVSQTKLGRLLRRPQVVREIDLQDQIWPAKEVEQGKYPKVQFYCLMSVADSYTDFHIDFGGSSVYYHILKGKKTFFFIPPTPKHLKAYQDWNDSHEQNYTFLPDITKECYRVDLGPGDTMLIPSGWIHAVWTPATSLVIGGNFLTRMSYRNQFRVYDIEKANGTPMKFRYPYFVRIMWYTVIQYLEKDPLPEEVSQSFLAGKQFERETPIWADYDGDLAAADSRSGAQNERYYSQAEVEGLPDLAQFVFRTVMVVMGRVEGISAEQMKRVNSSIPKGHGDPLDLARAFGLWVAWKRGNEDPPAWAHPDAVLPNRSEEGPPKKLSQRALKEMERKEAIAAWRIAPDRQSARVKKNNAAVAAASTSTSNNGSGSGPTAASPERESQVTSASTSKFIPTPSKPPPPSSPQQKQKQHGPISEGESHQSHHRNETTPSSRMNSSSTTTTTTTATMMSTQSMPFAMTAMHGQHLSTPKTSVLGPKRVACDACRKRRIRCKHKDFVMQIDDINNVTPLRTVRNGNYLNNFFDGHQQSPNAYGSPNDKSIDGQGFAPGTNAYVNANIPMAMNGIHIFGDAPKRGRSKACLECRKSKRRCIHDENGQVDPVKAAETPIPRGSASSKKRPFGSEGSPPQASMIGNDHLSTPQHHDDDVDSAMRRLSAALGGSNHVQTPPVFQMQVPPQTAVSNDVQHIPNGHDQNSLPIDPSLSAMYCEPNDSNVFVNHENPFASPDRSHAFGMPSLEQIASEVLDMNGGHGHPDEGFSAQESEVHQADVLNQGTENSVADLKGDVHKTDGSVDSAISLAASDSLDKTPPASSPSTSFNAEQLSGPIQRSVELNNAISSTSDSLATDAQPAASIPLYRPPPPPSASPELSKRQPLLPINGSKTAPSALPASTTPNKRKRDSHSEHSGSPTSMHKKPHLSVTQRRPSQVGHDGECSKPDGLVADVVEEVSQLFEEDAESLELAKALQQDDLGLRKRSK